MHEHSPVNPYLAPAIDEPGSSIYRGQGRVEFREDGKVMSIQWDSTFEDSLELNTFLLHELGTFSQVRRRQKFHLWLGVVLSIVGLIVLLSGQVQFTDGGLLVAIFIAILGPLFILTGARYQSSFKSRVEKAVRDGRNGADTIEVTITISPEEVSAQEQKYKLAYLWSGVSKIEVTHYGIVFGRDRNGAIQIPLRLFRSAEVAEKCETLAKKYWESARESYGEKSPKNPLTQSQD